MTEFTKHEQQQIRDGVKTSHRVLIEWQPERITDYPKYKWKCGRVLCETDADFAEWIVRFAPYKPGARIPADGGEIVVGDVRVQQIEEMSIEEFESEGYRFERPADCHAFNRRIFGKPHIGDGDPNSWVFVYEGLRWEQTE